MYAVVLTGGKQYRVSEGETLEVEKLEGEAGTKLDLPVLMVSDESKGAAAVGFSGTCTAEIVSHGKARKIIVFKYKAKKNERKKMGHRQSFTRIKIVKIG